MAKSTVKVVGNDAGFRELLKSPEMQADLRRRAQAIAEAAGEGFTASELHFSEKRAWVTVSTATFAARKAEAEGRALTRAIDAGR